MGITSRLKAILKICRAISHEAEKCAFELWITIRSVRQSGGDKNMFDSIFKEFDFVFRGRGVKLQGFGYRQRIWGVRRKPGREIRIFHIISIDVEDKESDRNFAAVASPYKSSEPVLGACLISQAPEGTAWCE